MIEKGVHVDLLQDARKRKRDEDIKIQKELIINEKIYS